MDPQTIIQILAQWKVVAVSLLVLVLLPLVFYIASLDKSGNVKSNNSPSSTGEQISAKEAEASNEEDSDQGGEGTQS